MNKTEKAAYQKELEKELEGGEVEDEIAQEGSSQRDIRPFMRVAAIAPDHETTITIGILGPVQKAIANTTAKKLIE